MNASRRGFTLVEVLVVMAITALVTTVLLQALSQVYLLQTRFGEQLSQSQAGAMRVDWWRQVVQGLEPDFVDGKRKFSGQSDRMEGLSTQGLGTELGGPKAFALELGNGELRYLAGEQATSLLRWPAGDRAEFAYLDSEGQAHPQWPPVSTRAEALQLPAAVLLRLSSPAGSEVLLATPRGVREARVRTFRLGATP